MYIEHENYSVSIDNNEEYNHIKEREFPDGFLYFKLLIEIDFLDDTNIGFASEITGRILKYLWSNNYSAVASCSYEAGLIEKGGYNSSNVPWPK